ncbi:hypothetical protein M2267_003780 [Ensifer sp. KUDG1]|uniref:hypothetical protein n=1 Tax=Ensifer sp. KUDG1 TaxID=3373919 RepID=UPI003D20FF04
MELDETPPELEAGLPPFVEFGQPIVERKLMKELASAQQRPGIEKKHETMEGRAQIVGHLTMNFQQELCRTDAQGAAAVIGRAAFMGDRLAERQDGLLKVLRHCPSPVIKPTPRKEPDAVLMNTVVCSLLPVFLAALISKSY